MINQFALAIKNIPDKIRTPPAYTRQDTGSFRNKYASVGTIRNESENTEYATDNGTILKIIIHNNVQVP